MSKNIVEDVQEDRQEEEVMRKKNGDEEIYEKVGGKGGDDRIILTWIFETVDDGFFDFLFDMIISCQTIPRQISILRLIKHFYPQST